MLALLGVRAIAGISIEQRRSIGDFSEIYLAFGATNSRNSGARAAQIETARR